LLLPSEDPPPFTGLLCRQVIRELGLGLKDFVPNLFRTISVRSCIDKSTAHHGTQVTVMQGQ